MIKLLYQSCTAYGILNLPLCNANYVEFLVDEYDVETTLIPLGNVELSLLTLSRGYTLREAY